MLNQVYDALEQILNSLNAGGEQSRAFADEIRAIRELLGYPGPIEGPCDEFQRRRFIARKLQRLAIEAQGLTACLPSLPLENWFDGTYEDGTLEVDFTEHDLASLLRFIADVGISEQS